MALISSFKEGYKMLQQSMQEDNKKSWKNIHPWGGGAYIYTPPFHSILRQNHMIQKAPSILKILHLKLVFGPSFGQKTVTICFGSIAISHCFQFGFFFYLFGFCRAFLRVGFRVKEQFLDPLMQTFNFGFGITAISCCFNSALIRISFAFFGPFWVWGQVQKQYMNLLEQTISFGFGSTAISFYF